MTPSWTRRSPSRLSSFHLDYSVLVVLVIAGGAVAASWRLVPLSGSIALRLLAGVLGALVVITLSVGLAQAVPKEHSAFEELANGPEEGPRSRPVRLSELETIVSGARRSGRDGFVKLRPVLRQIAASKLGLRGLSLDDDAHVLELLGESYPYLDARRERAEAAYRDGIDLDALERVVSTLEEL